MVDLHTHILPGIDDGACSVEESVQMIEDYYLHHINKVVCTPHFDPSKDTIADFVKKRDTAMSQVKDCNITLISGSETQLHDYLFYYSDLSSLSIGDTGYILLELPYTAKWDKKIFDKIENLMRMYSLIPIIAHIERYNAAKKGNRNLKRLIDLGCLLQLNASSVIDAKLRRRSIKLLKRGYIDVLASDCHNRKSRPPNLWKAYEIILSKLGDSCYERLAKNSDNILDGVNLRNKVLLQTEGEA
jgi:protein-tyrosine phosphatase